MRLVDSQWAYLKRELADRDRLSVPIKVNGTEGPEILSALGKEKGDLVGGEVGSRVHSV